MNSNQFLNAVNYIDDDKITTADRSINSKKSKSYIIKGFISIASIMLLFITMKILVPDTHHITTDEGLSNFDHSNITHSFEPYIPTNSNPDFAEPVIFFYEGYRYDLLDNYVNIEWSINTDISAVDLGVQLGEIQYGTYQASRSTAGQPYIISYGIFDENGSLQTNVYDHNKGKTFSENLNMEGGKVYTSKTYEYLLILEIAGEYRYFIGNIITETDLPFVNLMAFYDIPSSENITHIEVNTYTWENGYAEIPENLTGHYTINDSHKINDIIDLLLPLQSDRDNGSNFSKRRSAFREANDNPSPETTNIKLYLESGYYIELDYRQQYPYILFEVNDIYVPEAVAQALEVLIYDE